MPEPSATADPNSPSTILVDNRYVDLRNRPLAALLAWAVPGLGHAYQGRYFKSAVFFITIFSTWVFGFAIGGQHVVYASWQPGDQRWHYAIQAATGMVAMPAILQGRHANRYTDPQTGRSRPDYQPLWNGFMAPPHRPVNEAAADEVAAWYAVKGAGYEMGTWYTVIAGLLNILVIYDAFGGPSATPISGRRRVDDDESPSDTAVDEHTSGTTAAKATVESGTVEAGMAEDPPAASKRPKSRMKRKR